jgi:protein-tyrosine phosphatase
VIDLHFHCLPGIDDGPEDWDEAVALCQAAAEDGTDTIVATPHVLRGAWLNDDQAARDELILKLNSRLGGTPAVLPGCEFFFSSDAVELWESPVGPLTGLNRSSYLLVEFPAPAVPPSAESVFYELTLLGVTPVIAHPERNLEFARYPERLQQFVERGAIAQITAASVLGHFGRIAYRAAEEFFRRDLVHLIASDAHSTERRRPMLSQARAHVAREWGAVAEELLFELNPRAVIRSEPLPDVRMA